MNDDQKNPKVDLDTSTFKNIDLMKKMSANDLKKIMKKRKKTL